MRYSFFSGITIKLEIEERFIYYFNIIFLYVKCVTLLMLTPMLNFEKISM